MHLTDYVCCGKLSVMNLLSVSQSPVIQTNTFGVLNHCHLNQWHCGNYLELWHYAIMAIPVG